MAFHRTVLLLSLGIFMPHALHATAPSAAQHLSSLEQRLTKQFTAAQLPINATTMVKQLHKPLSFFFELGQQYPAAVPAFDAFLNRLITLTYTRGNAEELTHQREAALTSFVGALARILPTHTANPRVRRTAYQQVREVYNYYANRALTRSVQLGQAPARVISREEKMLRWFKTGAIIVAAATAATLVGTAIYQVAKTPAHTAPALQPDPAPAPAPSPAPTPAPTPPPSTPSTPGSTSAGSPAGSEQGVARDLLTEFDAAQDNTPVPTPQPAPLSTSQPPVMRAYLSLRLPPSSSSAPTPSPALSLSPAPAVNTTWHPAFKGVTEYDFNALLTRQYDTMTAGEDALPIVVQLNPTELAPYFTQIGGKKKVKKKLLHAAIHRALVHDKSIAERKALAARMAATRGNADRLIVLIPSGAKFSETLGLTAADVAAVGKEFWTTDADSNLQRQLNDDWQFIDGKMGKFDAEEQVQFRLLFRPQPLPTE